MNSGDSHLVKIPVYFKDLCVVGGLEMVMLADFHVRVAMFERRRQIALKMHICDDTCAIGVAVCS